MNWKTENCQIGVNVQAPGGGTCPSPLSVRAPLAGDANDKNKFTTYTK